MIEVQGLNNKIVKGTTLFSPKSVREVGIHDVKILDATEESLEGYGVLIDDFASAAVEIVTWPAPGWRPVLAGTGNEGGVTQGDFVMEWRGDVCHTFNHAVNKGYVTGWSCDPHDASSSARTCPREFVYTFEANYHPDGGQVFMPRDPLPFVALLAKPGDNVAPNDFRAFYFSGHRGLMIHPGVWHQPMFPVSDRMTFDDKQGKVHACIAVQFVEEFGVYLRVPLSRRIEKA